MPTRVEQIQPHKKSGRRLLLERIFRNSLTRGAIGLLASSIIYFAPSITIDPDTNNLPRFVSDILAAITNQDPADPNLSRKIGILGSLASLGYLGSGQALDYLFGLEDRELGFKAVPKRWNSHTVVLDPNRVLIDSIIKEKGQEQVVWAHNAASLVEGKLPNYPDHSDNTLWHVNYGIEAFASDTDFLSKTKPQHAKRLVIPLWNRDQALYTETQRGNLLISPEVAALIARTWKKLGGKKVTIIASKDITVDSPTKGSNIELTEYFNGQGLKNVEVEYVEDIVKRELPKTTIMITDITKIEQLLQKNFGNAVYTQNATVYCSDDAKSISEGTVLLNSGKYKTVTVVIENPDNKDEAQNAGLTPVVIPNLIAKKLYNIE